MFNKSNRVIWWLSMSIVAIVLVAGLSPNFWQSCKEIVGEGVKQIKEMVNPVPPRSNRYAEFLSRLKETGWQDQDANKPGNCSVSGPSTDPSSPPSAAECELRNLKNDSEITEALNKLQNVKGNLAVSLIFVPPSDQDRHWLEKDFTNFADVNGWSWSNIVAKQKTLRERFEAFQTVAKSFNALKTQCRPDSSNFPYLALACRVAEEAKKPMTPPLQESEWKTLPFFSKNDVLRVKSLSNVADRAEELKVIKYKSDATVLEKLCRLAEEQEIIQSFIASEMKEDKVDNADVKKMTEAVLKFVGEVKTCP